MMSISQPISMELPPQDVHSIIPYVLVYKDLSEKERQCCELHYREGYSFAAIGEMLGISKGSVQSYIGRARRKVEEVQVH